MPIAEKLKPIIRGQDETKRLLDVACDKDLPTLLVGETGTGKTSLIREMADKHNRYYTRFSITGETTVDDFVGKYILKDGETIWQDGILLIAAKKGHYLVVDEVNAALPEILFVLHSLLDDDKCVIVPQKDSSVVKPHKDFRFFATMNPVDEYAGTKELNKAFMSRFAMVLVIEYPNREVETEVLKERTEIKDADAMKMVDIAIGVRRAKKDDKLFYTLSTRDLIYWGALVEPLGMHQAFRVTIRNKGFEDSQTIEKIYSQVFADYTKEAISVDEITNLESLKKLKAKYKRQAITKSKKDLTKELNNVELARAELDRLVSDFNKKSGIDKEMIAKAINSGHVQYNPQFKLDKNGKAVAVSSGTEGIDLLDVPF